MMGKKDFIALANHIKEQKGYFGDEQLSSIADFLATQNPRFKREVFLGYIAGTCGQSGGRPRRTKKEMSKK